MKSTLEESKAGCKDIVWGTIATVHGLNDSLDALNADPDASPKEVLSNVMRGIDAFVMGAQQFDDITMLCLKYNGPAQSEA